MITPEAVIRPSIPSVRGLTMGEPLVCLPCSKYETGRANIILITRVYIVPRNGVEAAYVWPVAFSHLHDETGP